MPTMAKLLRSGAKASGDGLLTQAPPNTGAGWYSLATGAWPGVHGSTNNTFHVNGQPFGNRTASFDSGVLQAETLAQSAERGGKKVAQIEWAGGRVGVINGPTVDFLTFLSGRGVATNYISPDDNAAFVASFGLQFDHPAGFAGQAPFAGAQPTDATGWSGTPQSFSPPKEMRLRVLDFGVRQVRLERVHLRLHQRPQGQLQQGAVLADQERCERRRHAGQGSVGRRQGEDLRWRARRPDRRHAREGRRADREPLEGSPVPHLRLTCDRELAGLVRVRFHRRLRRVPRPEVPHRHGCRLRDRGSRHRQRGDVRAAGPVLGDRAISR